MTDEVKRPYQLRARAERAAATRAAIRRAAADLFLEHGFGATTMRDVARHAGVGERTVYDTFPTKTALFDHVVNVAIVGDEEATAVSDRPEFRAALTERDARRAIERLAAYSTDVLERAGPLIMVAAHAAGTDDHLRRFNDRGEAATTANMTAFARSLARHRQLRTSAPDAVAVLVAVASPHTHQHLRGKVGWSAARYQRWLIETLAAALLKPAPQG